jgi:ParB family transcriptional regulator, chromosome partitioning protein
MDALAPQLHIRPAKDAGRKKGEIMDRVNPKDVETRPFFEELFPMQPKLLEKIETDMREGTYDLSQPVILATWNGQKEPVCIDGHTRLKAAINAGIEELPVWTHEFDTEEEAIKKAIMLQQNRRNMSDADIVACVAALDSRRMRGGDRRSDEAKSKASSDAIENPPSKSAAETAELMGISTTKVERTRTLLDHGDPETIDEVKQGKKSINKATKEIREKRRKKAPEDKPNKQPSEPSEEQPGDTGARMVSISLEYYGRLKELGGSIDDHVARAIERYLYLLRAEPQSEVYDEDEYFDDGDYDD